MEMTLKKLVTALAAAALGLGATAASADSGAADSARTQSNAQKASFKEAPEWLRVWISGRAGKGEAVHWVADGAVYEYPSGKKLFGLIGLESSTVIWPQEPGEKIIHLTRKTFAYTDKDTGEVLTEYNGNKVEPIAYPYQLIRYRSENNRVYGDVEQGVGERIQLIESVNGIPFRKLGDTYIYNAAVWLDFPLPSGAQYQAWENYDFFFHREGSVEEPHQMSWQRYGKMPSWAGGQQVITHLHSWRVESHDEIPANILDWVRKDKPMWLQPPANLEEVKALQEGRGGPGWSG